MNDCLRWQSYWKQKTETKKGKRAMATNREIRQRQLRLINEGRRGLLFGVQPLVVRSSLNTLVCVDREGPFVLPRWINKVFCPWIQNSGPELYNFRDIIDLKFVDDDDEPYDTIDDTVYNRPFSESFLGVCLGLRDSIRISHAVSYSVFRETYERSSLFCLKTIVSDRKGKRFVPFLYGNQTTERVCVGWCDTTTTICADDVFAGYPLTTTNQ